MNIAQHKMNNCWVYWKISVISFAVLQLPFCFAMEKRDWDLQAAGSLHRGIHQSWLAKQKMDCTVEGRLELS